MSARYSSSPTLHLKIGNSHLRIVLYCCFNLGLLLALALLYQRGWPLLAFALVIPVGAALWRMRLDPMVGASLGWCDGVWQLQNHDEVMVITLSKRSVATRWFIYVAFQRDGGDAVRSLWLLPDSAPSAQLRLLRVRLTLEC